MAFVESRLSSLWCWSVPSLYNLASYVENPRKKIIALCTAHRLLFFLRPPEGLVATPLATHCFYLSSSFNQPLCACSTPYQSKSSEISTVSCVTARHGAKPVPMPAMITGFSGSLKWMGWHGSVRELEDLKKGVLLGRQDFLMPNTTPRRCPVPRALNFDTFVLDRNMVTDITTGKKTLMANAWVSYSGKKWGNLRWRKTQIWAFYNSVRKKWSKFSTNFCCRWWMMIPSTRDPPLPTCFTVTARIIETATLETYLPGLEEIHWQERSSHVFTSYFFFSFAGCSGNPGFGTMFLVLYFHRWHCCTSDSKSGCMIVASWALVSATIDDQPQQLRMAGGMQDPKQLSKCQPEIYHFCC